MVCHWRRSSARLVGSGPIPICRLHWLRHRQSCGGRPGHEGALPTHSRIAVNVFQSGVYLGQASSCMHVTLHASHSSFQQLLVPTACFLSEKLQRHPDSQSTALLMHTSGGILSEQELHLCCCRHLRLASILFRARGTNSQLMCMAVRQRAPHSLKGRNVTGNPAFRLSMWPSAGRQM